ncbi:MAG: hypothetical protein A2W31_15325 [Planctomycetes bacterium RBG_16_64_10]|nr:MAG: hypothetical protein A2W31_15325 [Planctomycetes bacterium RBG_16_64_10]
MKVPVIGVGGKHNAEPTANPYRWYSPRCWHGMRTGDWLRLLRDNHFRIAPTRWGLASPVSIATLVNSVLHRCQQVCLGRRIAATELVADPIFIIGHWRSGTTLLHELMVQDDRFTFANTYACFAPTHFVFSRPLIVPWLRFLLPAVRPMDNMRFGWDRPPEDEFALLAMGLPSPYESLAFPNQIRPGLARFDDGSWTPADRQRWKDQLVWFLKCITYGDPRQIVLKSPPHTRRVKTLLEVFPGARFVHIVREPYSLFASTVRLWQSLTANQGLQVPTHADLEESVLAGLEQMYVALGAQAHEIDRSRYVEIRYEDLVVDPPSVMRRIYDSLGLGGFESYLPRLTAYWDGVADYQARQYDVDPGTRRKIAQRWGRFFAPYGYSI